MRLTEAWSAGEYGDGEKARDEGKEGEGNHTTLFSLSSSLLNSSRSDVDSEGQGGDTEDEETKMGDGRRLEGSGREGEESWLAGGVGMVLEFRAQNMFDCAEAFSADIVVCETKVPKAAEKVGRK